MTRRLRLIVGFVAAISIVACVAPTGRDRPALGRLRSIDGLDRVEISARGVLDLRENHGIGSYDAFLIRDAVLRYRRRSARLTSDAESVFLSLLHGTLLEAATAADIPIVETRGPCVMEIDLEVFDMKLDPLDRNDALADLTLIMQFRDSSSGESLLRYATQNRVEHPTRRGHDADRQLQKGFDRIIAEMDISVALRASGLADDTIEPGCNGTLAARGRAAAQRQQE
jgi:hypothetical protein